jgi:hypothetical protein
MKLIYRTALALALISLIGAATAAGQTPNKEMAYAPKIDPENFATVVNHPFYPLVPGSKYVYRERGGSEKVEVSVTNLTKQILGVTCTVVESYEYDGDELIEETFDWFAQDLDGNVWYFGEKTHTFKDGKLADSAGSWEAGVDGAQPGIIMPGTLKVGNSYRQEYYAGKAEDMGQVVRLDDSVTVPFGYFKGVLVTKDWTPLEPDLFEHKYYSAGVGLVLEQGGDERVELISYTKADMAVPDMR